MIDAIIVGQGIAGSILAYQLLQEGLSIQIFHDQKKESASQIAAGLIQSISGRHLSIADDSLKQILFAIHYYKFLEKQLNTSFFSEISCYRYLTEEQLKKWQKKSTIEPYKYYLSSELVTPPHNVNKALSFIEVLNNYLVNPAVLLAAFYDFFKQKNCISEHCFDESGIEYHSDYVSYNGIKAKRLILCLGHHISELDLFKHVDFQNIKGETMTISNIKQSLDVVYQNSEWIVPYHNDTYRVGATYDHNLTTEITPKGQETLTQFLNTLGVEYYNITGQHAGIRCVTKNRKPLIAPHPEKERILAFSGFGSKGFMTCPYYVDLFMKTFY